MIKKVFFIGDHYRGDQKQNVKNLYTLLSPIFVDMDVEAFLLDDVYNKELKVAWGGSLDGQGESILFEYDLSSSLIIAFEMSPLDRNYLDAHNIPWIDIEIHPIRFLDDLYFSIKTSIDYDFTELTISKSHIQFAANILKSEYKAFKFDIEENSLLIVGQTPIDKSLYYDGEFKNILNYAKELDKICSNYTKIYYRPHPYLTDVNIDKEIVSRYNASMLRNESYYGLLASDNLRAVCGISSSSLYEAEYFSKDVYFLEKRTKKYAQPISLKNFMECSIFWEKILGQNINFLQNKLRFNISKNTCRNIYAYWSFESYEMKLEDRLDKSINGISRKVDNLEAKSNEYKVIVNNNEFKVKELEFKAKEIELKAHELALKVNKAEEKGLKYIALYTDVVNSNSWKMTKPIRVVGKKIRTILKKIKNVFFKSSKIDKTLDKRDQYLISLKGEIEKRKSQYTIDKSDD